MTTLSFEYLKKEISIILSINPSELFPTTKLNGNDKWDSFSMLASVALVTKHTGKQIILQDIEELSTVTDLVNLCQKLKDE